MSQSIPDNGLEVKTLRHSLHLWQAWEVDYEGLKEVIKASRPNSDAHQLTALAKDYKADRLTAKEVEEILGPIKQRSVERILNTLERRLDYVQRNLRTIEKQLIDLEAEATAARHGRSDLMDAVELPVTEIIEELDEDDNVIASHTSTNRDTKAQLMDVLKQAGIATPADTTGSDTDGEMSEQRRGNSIRNALHKMGGESSYEDGLSSLMTVSDSESRDGQSDVRLQSKLGFEDHSGGNISSLERLPRKEAATSTKDTKLGPGVQMSRAAERVTELMKNNRRDADTVLDSPIIPANESAEDAALRREMLDYAMSEVGAVVAELQLEEEGDWSDDQDIEYEDSSVSSDDEDEYGRTRRSIIDDEYRQQKMEVEQRLGVHMQNLGKDYEVSRAGDGADVIRSEDFVACEASNCKFSEEETKSRIGSKKEVRFSEQLSIAQGFKIEGRTDALVGKQKSRAATPVHDFDERAVPSTALSAPLNGSKESGFKSARSVTMDTSRTTTDHSAASQVQPISHRSFIPTLLPFEPTSVLTSDVPTGPEGKVLAPRVIERDIVVDNLAVEPNSLDPRLHYQEVATEYNRTRNRRIQQKGGFKTQEEDGVLMTFESGGRAKKMSRFKAARLDEF